MRAGKADWLGPATALSAQVSESGPLVASVAVETRGWALGPARHDTVAEYAIGAGSRLTHVRVRSTPGAPLAAGIVKHPGVEILRREGETWGYVASFGDQSLAHDALGLVVFYRLDQTLSRGDDGATLYVAFRDGPIDYAFAAIWRQEPGAPSTLEALKAWLDATLETLDRPVQVKPAP
jgi:hypothetical protein